MAWSTSNVTAGSDTTAILLRTIFYNLLKSPSTMKKLLDELSSTIEKGSSEFVTWKESRELPYLDACIKEAGRMHPPFGLPLERVVPEGGAEICGKFLVAGTVVGMGGSVTHRHKETFGDDCDVWRPERWLCDKENKRRMENSLLTVSITLAMGHHTLEEWALIINSLVLGIGCALERIYRIWRCIRWCRLCCGYMR